MQPPLVRNHRSRPRSLLHSAGVALFLALAASTIPVSGALTAQDSEAPSLFGDVLSQRGAPIAVAEVELIEVDTESSRTTTTNAEGRYEFNDLEAGTTYRLVVRSAGYSMTQRDDIQLSPFERRRENVVMVSPEFALEGIDVTVDRRFDRALSGPSISVTREEVLAHPTTERNFLELATLSPVAVQTSDGGEVSISGQNERHNAILVDGALNQDVFGASPSGIPGAAARAKPIPFDAIQQFRIEAAPFDVGVSGFTGGVMDATTRSGTNEWEGSVFSEFRNQHFFGSLELEGADVAPEEFSKYVWGFNVGGPIRRDEAHFFVAAEFEDRSEPSLGFIEGTHDVLQTRVSPDSLARMTEILQSGYGMDPGTSGQVSLGNPLANIFARLDWQISEAHRMVLRHNYSGAARDSTPNRAPVGPYEFSSAGYRAESSSHAFSSRLISDFGPNLANQFSFNVQRIGEEALPASLAPMLDVTIRGASDGVGLRRDVRAGSRYYSQQNALDQTIVQLNNRMVVSHGDVNTTLGLGLDYFRFDHDYRPGSRGYYRFDDLGQLEANQASYYEVSLRNPEFSDPTVRFSVAQPHFYVQNEQDFPDGLVLNYGMRVDIPMFLGSPLYNEAVDDAFGLRTDNLPANRVTFTPRMGFNWQPLTRLRTQFRGSIGVFTANLPYTWMADAVRHTGLGTQILTCSAGNTPAYDPAAPAPIQCADGSGAESAAQGRVVGFRDDFALPRELKITTSLDQELPGNIVMTMETLMIPTFSRTAVRDLNLPPVGVAGDREYNAAFGERANYGNATATGYSANRRLEQFSQVLQIENEKRAAIAFGATLQLERPMAEWLTLTGSVSVSRTTDEQSLTFGDMATSLAATPIGQIANQYTARPANFDRPYKYLLNARMRVAERFGGARVSVLYVGQSGQPYSYVYGSDINGDGFPGAGIPLDGSNDLIFVPNDPVRIPGSLVTKQLFAQFVGGVEECLSDVRGQIATRNSCRTPMTHMVDLSIAQPFSVGGARFEVTGDMLNVLNLFNSEWGQVWEVDPVVPILDFVGRADTDMQGNVDPNSAPQLGFTGPVVRDSETGGLRPVLPHNLVVPASQWQAQVGLRVYF